jgi:hypothetical protein
MMWLLALSPVLLGSIPLAFPSDWKTDLKTKAADSPFHFPDSSYRFLTPDGKAAVQFPDKPRQSKRTLRSRDGSITLQLATYATAEGNIFLFGYADLPSIPHEPDTVLQGILEGLIRDNPTIRWKKVAFGEEQLPGLEVTWRKNDKDMVCRYILNKRRLYQIMVLGSQQFVTGDSARAFLNSFVIE